MDVNMHCLFTAYRLYILIRFGNDILGIVRSLKLEFITSNYGSMDDYNVLLFITKSLTKHTRHMSWNLQ